MTKIVITMPAYHAEKTLERTVSAIPEGIADELILVDDASRDDTAEVARRLGLQVHVHPSNRGYGGNQKSCYRLALESGADVVVLLHPDYQYEPKAVPLLIAPILAGDADMTFGSRFAGMGDPIAGGMPLYRYVGNRITTVAQNLLLGTRFTDMHSGMRAYTRRALLTLPFLGYPEGFSFDAALLVDAVTSGLRVVEVPIPTRYTKESSSISIRRSLQYVFNGTRYAASASIRRGRRGRRYVPGAVRRARRIEVDEVPPPACPACGSTDLRSRYASTADPTPRAQEFACTARTLGSHDTIARCNRCGLMMARPFMPAETLHSFYEQADDPAYLDEEQVRRATFSWLLARIESHYTSGRNLLELGSHVGLFLSEATAAGWTASGVEPSTWAVKEGRQRYDVELDHGTAEDVDRPSGSVDVLAMFEVLDHVADPLTVLRRSRTLLSPEGLLAASVADTRGPHARLSGSRWPWYMRAHRTYLTPSTLALMLDRAGFRLTAWQRVPKSMHLSYIGERAADREPYGSVAIVARHVDPRVPVGWLGDSVLFVARPT